MTSAHKHVHDGAGIAHNKILAKLASGLHKPAQQTVVCLGAVPGLLRDLPIPKLRNLGGKFGDQVMSELGISTVGAPVLWMLPFCLVRQMTSVWSLSKLCLASCG